jgi:hypothetical protein
MGGAGISTIFVTSSQPARRTLNKNKLIVVPRNMAEPPWVFLIGGEARAEREYAEGGRKERAYPSNRLAVCCFAFADA